MSDFLKSLMAELMPAIMKPRLPQPAVKHPDAVLSGADVRTLLERPPRRAQRKAYKPAPDHRLRSSHL